ncbi:hypothetical protein K488DRAFT_82017 [Vararia minispora EC-137]|uniref:Uncharacterized protein n=1 Tax=Vararia minispora EC-137 TaxID=1314806 RepID=A0ACB8QYE7_9AGAM|nr:hypothetical protein K488DRAFT_82017 [Vararia minispora EC-137]
MVLNHLNRARILRLTVQTDRDIDEIWTRISRGEAPRLQELALFWRGTLQKDIQHSDFSLLELRVIMLENVHLADLRLSPLLCPALVNLSLVNCGETWTSLDSLVHTLQRLPTLVSLTLDKVLPPVRSYSRQSSNRQSALLQKLDKLTLGGECLSLTAALRAIDCPRACTIALHPSFHRNADLSTQTLQLRGLKDELSDRFDETDECEFFDSLAVQDDSFWIRSKLRMFARCSPDASRRGLPNQIELTLTWPVRVAWATHVIALLATVGSPIPRLAGLSTFTIDAYTLGCGTALGNLLQDVRSTRKMQISAASGLYNPLPTAMESTKGHEPLFPQCRVLHVQGIDFSQPLCAGQLTLLDVLLDGLVDAAVCRVDIVECDVSDEGLRRLRDAYAGRVTWDEKDIARCDPEGPPFAIRSEAW